MPEKAVDANLKVLAPLKNLTTLDLSYALGDGYGFERCGRTSRTLTTLNLYPRQCTDAGLKNLAALTNLTTLTLRLHKDNGRGC